MSKRIFFVGSCVLLLLNLLQTVNAAQQVGPIDTSGEIDGAPYRIVVPAAWNGTLLVYAHGYRDKADHPGQVANRTPPVAPNAALAPAVRAP